MSRDPGDGLRIFPGAVTSRGLWAAPWTPDVSVSDASGAVWPEAIWAALDCPSGIAAAEAASLDQDTAILLGRMTADLVALPAAAIACRVIAWPAGRDGRKLTAGSAVTRAGRRGARHGQHPVADRSAPGTGGGRRGGVVTARRRGVALTPMETRRDVIVRAAMLADELGYETFSVPEGWGLDSIPVLTEIALRTTAIKVVSGIMSVWGRTPATLAMTAATLHQVSTGRFVLGLGASTSALAEGFHDIPFEHPAARLRDAVTKVRALLGGQPAQLDHASSARPLRLGQPPAPEVPIWVAALGEHTMRVAAEARRRLDPLPGRPRQPPRLAGPAERPARSHRAACADPHDRHRAHHRRRRRRVPGPGHRGQLHRLVPDRHG